MQSLACRKASATGPQAPQLRLSNSAPSLDPCARVGGNFMSLMMRTFAFADLLASSVVCLAGRGN